MTKEDDISKMLEETFVTKSDFEKKLGSITKDDMKDIVSFVENLNKCKDDNCGIHQAKKNIEDKSFMLGFAVRDLLK